MCVFAADTKQYNIIFSSDGGTRGFTCGFAHWRTSGIENFCSR